MRTLPSANDAAARKTNSCETVLVVTRLSGLGLLRTTTPAKPRRSPAIPSAVSLSSGSKPRAKPVVRTGDRLTMMAAAALVVPCSPTNRKA